MIQEKIKKKIIEAVKMLYNSDIAEEKIILEPTKENFEGDWTVVVFNLLAISKKNLNITANELAEYLQKNIEEIENYNIVKGFLNISLKNNYWNKFLDANFKNEKFGICTEKDEDGVVMIEYSSPNTNKPLHLGHIRNNLLGNSIAKILRAAGNKVVEVNLVNDRGIHICKSMLAYQKWGNGTTPELSGKKGDKLVGDFYVMFEKELVKQAKELINKGLAEDEARRKSNIMQEAQEMLNKWENQDKETIELWKKMNSWVYHGFENTYKKLQINFDKTYYESNTYLLGKEIILNKLKENIAGLHKKEDGSIWIDLANEGMDEKLLLRGDGTSVYISQDIGTAVQRFSEYPIKQHIYVVGDEQNYHFQVLSIVLDKFGYQFAKNIFHLSYGMVELPEGKMKSREGKTVEADELIDEMITTAKEKSEELGKLDNLSEEEKEQNYQIIGLAALKYFILKVTPQKRMIFNPSESIDLQGNTAPFIQYTCTRINSLLEKASKIVNFENKLVNEDIDIEISKKEKNILLLNSQFSQTVSEAAANLNPSAIANFIYTLAKEYNQFYQLCPVLSESDKNKMILRIKISILTLNTIKNGLGLLGISVPQRM